jgi:hypothetical protein
MNALAAERCGEPETRHIEETRSARSPGVQGRDSIDERLANRRLRPSGAFRKIVRDDRASLGMGVHRNLAKPKLHIVPRLRRGAAHPEALQVVPLTHPQDLAAGAGRLFRIERGLDPVYNNVSPDTSFFETLDVLNERLEEKGERPVAFDHDLRSLLRRVQHHGEMAGLPRSIACSSRMSYY